MQKHESITIYLTTSRDKSAAIYAEKKLKEYGLAIEGCIHSLPHGRRYLINDLSVSNPYPTSIAINLKRDSNSLKDFI